MAAPAPHLFGVRHHGPGSARSLEAALEALQPDCLLLEAPAEAETVLGFVGSEELRPPVAILVYDPSEPSRASYLPFGEFSPEWRALIHAARRRIPVRMMDLPRGFDAPEPDSKSGTGTGPEPVSDAASTSSPEPGPGPGPAAGEGDPWGFLARLSGLQDPEEWWEQCVERQGGAVEVFAAVHEAMCALRKSGRVTSLQRSDPAREERREAHMRQVLRAAQKEGFQRIAVVCGAWHTPALAEMPTAKEDAARLKGGTKRRMSATWIPWTHGRLTFESGYGAGVASPGWYGFLWDHGTAPDATTRWMVHVARLLRGEDLDASSAGVIEVVRLAETLADLRGLRVPGLGEMDQAVLTVFCGGQEGPLRLVREKLVVGDRMGRVPDGVPSVPLVDDVAREQRRLRLPPEALDRDLELDLRKPNDLDRSRLLHRLDLVGVPWGRLLVSPASHRGTFHEKWRLRWMPEFAVALIQAGAWGNTLEAAATTRVVLLSAETDSLPGLTPLLPRALLSDLPGAVGPVMGRLQALAAASGDVAHLMDALPPLASLGRYGSVRQHDVETVLGIVDGLVARIGVALPVACGSLSSEAAEEVFPRVLAVQEAVALLQRPGHAEAWQGALSRLAGLPGIHGLVAGRACRLLMQAGRMDAAEVARRLGLALSPASGPESAAAWVDGLLRGSGLMVVHDPVLWRLLDDWLVSLRGEAFRTVLPLLRRTFSNFPVAERRQIAALADAAASGRLGLEGSAAAVTDVDVGRARAALPIVSRLLGLPHLPT